MAKTHHPIGYCPIHGFFPVSGFVLGDGADAVLQGVVTSCPRCGGVVDIVSGHYEVVGDRLNVLLDQSIPSAALDELRRIAEQLQRAEITPAEAKTRATAVAPKAAKLFDVANWSESSRAAVLVAIIGAIGVVAAARMGGSSTTVNVINQPSIERVVPDMPRRGPLPGLPGGKPLKI